MDLFGKLENRIKAADRDLKFLGFDCHFRQPYITDCGV